MCATQVTDFFSYEHFYVIYCKFWELDTDHDLEIDAEDLLRHRDFGKWLNDLANNKQFKVLVLFLFALLFTVYLFIN